MGAPRRPAGAPGGATAVEADYRAVTDAALSVDGADCGALRPLPADLGVGLSSFSTRPAVVHVTTRIEDRGR